METEEALEVIWAFLHPRKVGFWCERVKTFSQFRHSRSSSWSLAFMSWARQLIWSTGPARGVVDGWVDHIQHSSFSWAFELQRAHLMYTFKSIWYVEKYSDVWGCESAKAFYYAGPGYAHALAMSNIEIAKMGRAVIPAWCQCSHGINHEQVHRVNQDYWNSSTFNIPMVPHRK